MGAWHADGSRAARRHLDGGCGRPAYGWPTCVRCDVRLADLTWRELGEVPGERPLTLLVPLGSVEQHGPHLPLGTDTLIADAVATALERADPGLVLAPALGYGASGEHEGFAGTVSIGHAALRLLLIEYGRSACRWAQRLAFVNGHGGNVAALVEAVRLLRSEGRDVGWLPCSAPGRQGDAHAGRTETSLLLALANGQVRTAHAESGNTTPLPELMPRLREQGVRGVSPNGILGDPAGASAAEGESLLAAIVTAATAALTCWTPDPTTGHLTVPTSTG